VELTDTRKTLPGLRSLQKYAVRVGGGSNHRYALWDGILIKDNHIVAAGSVGEAVRRARASTAFPVQVECSSLDDVNEALEAGAAAILLDNRTPEELGPLVEHIRTKRPHVLIEASGGVTLDNVAAVAASEVDRVSVGAFTHSAPALDLSMKLEDIREET
jgi:nicotinate-nucleotide pyrophosphorylase (carboxylating)